MPYIEWAQRERAELIKRIAKLKAFRRKDCITAAEFAEHLAELQAELDYAELKIAAYNSGDDFDYDEAAEHIDSVREDILACIEHWGYMHGLSPAQCEQIYIAAHIDRNFDEELDRPLINALIEYFKRLNAAG